MLTHSFEDLAQTFRVLLESNWKLHQLLPVDRAEAIGTIETAINAKLNAFHNLYDLMLQNGVNPPNWYEVQSFVPFWQYEMLGTTIRLIAFGIYTTTIDTLRQSQQVRNAISMSTSPPLLKKRVETVSMCRFLGMTLICFFPCHERTQGSSQNQQRRFGNI